MTQDQQSSETGDQMQLPLLLDYAPVVRVPKAVRKPVEVIHIYPVEGEFDLFARRVYNALLVISSQQWEMYPPEQQERILVERRVIGFQAPIARIRKIMGRTTKTNQRFVDALEKLQTLKFRFDVTRESDGEWEVVTQLLGQYAKPKVADPEKMRELRWDYHPDIFALLMKPSRYALIGMQLSNSLKSQFTLALYENTHRYVNNPGMRTARMSVLTWMELICSGAPSLKRYKKDGNYRFFKREVLMPALNDLNKAEICPLTLDLREFKEGNKVVELQFLLKRKARHPLAALEGDEASADPDLVGSLKELGFPAQEIQQFLKTDHDDVRMALVATQAAVRAGNIRSTAAFFRAALKNKYQPSQSIEEREQSRERERQNKQKTALAKKAAQEAFVRHRGEATRSYYAKQAPLLQKALVEMFMATPDGARVRAGYDDRAFDSPAFCGSFYAWLSSQDGVLTDSHEQSLEAFIAWRESQPS